MVFCNRWDVHRLRFSNNVEYYFRILLLDDLGVWDWGFACEYYFLTDECGRWLYQLSNVFRLICDIYVSFYGLIIFCFDDGVEWKPSEVLDSFIKTFWFDGVSLPLMRIFDRLCFRSLPSVWRKSFIKGSANRLSYSSSITMVDFLLYFEDALLLNLKVI